MGLILAGRISLLVQMYDIPMLTLHLHSIVRDQAIRAIRIDEMKYDMAIRRHNAMCGREGKPIQMLICARKHHKVFHGRYINRI